MELGFEIKEFLKKFKVYYPQSLFEPDWSLLKDNRCPICSNKLYFPRSGKIAYCKGKKHKSFIIKIETLKRVKALMK